MSGTVEDGSETGGDYFRKYYEENRDEINRKRRQRYNNDDDYRDRSLAASKRYREKRRKKGRVRVARLGQARSHETGDGGKIQLFSVGVFSSFIGRSAQSLSHWERRGIMPYTPYRDTRGYRLYSRGMMQVVKDEVGDKRRLFPVDEEMITRISDAWADMGIPVDLAEETVELDYALAKTEGKKEAAWVKARAKQEQQEE